MVSRGVAPDATNGLAGGSAVGRTELIYQKAVWAFEELVFDFDGSDSGAPVTPPARLHSQKKVRS